MLKALAGDTISFNDFAHFLDFYVAISAGSVGVVIKTNVFEGKNS